MISLCANAQEKFEDLCFRLGATFNVSPGSDEFNSSTGLGLFAESDYLIKERVRLGVRFEPTALAWGVLTLPGGCGGECKEGSNYLINNYLKAEYMIGQPKYGPKKEKYQGYVGLNFLVLTHKRYIITSRIPGNYQDTRRTMTNLGFGIRSGALLRRVDLSASFNWTGNDFQQYFGFNLGYTVWQKRN